MSIMSIGLLDVPCIISSGAERMSGILVGWTDTEYSILNANDYLEHHQRSTTNIEFPGLYERFLDMGDEPTEPVNVNRDLEPVAPAPQWMDTKEATAPKVLNENEKLALSSLGKLVGPGYYSVVWGEVYMADSDLALISPFVLSRATRLHTMPSGATIRRLPDPPQVIQLAINDWTPVPQGAYIVRDAPVEMKRAVSEDCFVVPVGSICQVTGNEWRGMTNRSFIPKHDSQARGMTAKLEVWTSEAVEKLVEFRHRSGTLQALEEARSRAAREAGVKTDR